MLQTNSALKSQFHFTNLNISVLTIKNYDKQNLLSLHFTLSFSA